MAGRKLVNLDAMIPRADFAILEKSSAAPEKLFESLGVRELRSDGLPLPLLRKPDFQRETNHWTPAQVASLIKSFADGDLIPSVILWKAQGTIFVIDGGHRLSVLRAWIEDDYGDREISQKFFGFDINSIQKKAAAETRSLIEKEVGSYKATIAATEIEGAPETKRERAAVVRSRSIPVQWVTGDAERAQASFLKINTQGTPLDEIEMLLIWNRKRPGAIAARSIIRAGMGHKYWSNFSAENQKLIETKAKTLYQILFEPDLQSPIKTLDLPLGGGSGVRTALKLLVDFVITASRNQAGTPDKISDQDEDATGEATIQVLDKSLRLAQRITGNDKGSLGLHPLVYFYGPAGTHSGPLFMGVATLLARKLINNDSSFFPKFTRVRKELEILLIKEKALIAALVVNTRSTRRYDMIAGLLTYLIDSIDNGDKPTEQDLVRHAGLDGRVFVGEEKTKSTKFREETRSAVMIREGLAAALHCAVCGGYLDPAKSVSYDHIKRVREGGKGTEENCQLAHPYCNQSVKQ
jgi:hypothetical protein